MSSMVMATPWMPLALLHANVVTLAPMALCFGLGNVVVAGVAGPPPPHPDLLAHGTPRGLAERRPPQSPLHHVLRGLHAGDLETVLLTVAMAAEENRLPCADPDEEARILAFLARLAEHDATLPPPPSGAGVGAGGAAGRHRGGRRGARPRVSATAAG
jgi:hypothetical protein